MPKLLFIEDDDQLIKLYKNILEDEGFIVTTAQTGKDGLGQLSKDRPDLIILDIMLPGGMNGFDVLEQLKKTDEYKTIPIFVLTNLDGEEKMAKKIGAVDCIVKAHVDPKDVVLKIKNTLQL